MMACRLESTNADSSGMICGMSDPRVRLNHGFRQSAEQPEPAQHEVALFLSLFMERQLRLLYLRCRRFQFVAYHVRDSYAREKTNIYLLLYTLPLDKQRASRSIRCPLTTALGTGSPCKGKPQSPPHRSSAARTGRTDLDLG